MDILFFIQLLRDSIPNSVEIYTKGNCGAFALILQSKYPEGIILYNEDHCIFEYGRHEYDITGDVTNKYPGMIPLDNYIEYDKLKILQNSYEKDNV